MLWRVLPHANQKFLAANEQVTQDHYKNIVIAGIINKYGHTAIDRIDIHVTSVGGGGGGGGGRVSL